MREKNIFSILFTLFLFSNVQAQEFDVITQVNLTYDYNHSLNNVPIGYSFNATQFYESQDLTIDSSKEILITTLDDETLDFEVEQNNIQDSTTNTTVWFGYNTTANQDIAFEIKIGDDVNDTEDPVSLWNKSGYLAVYHLHDGNDSSGNNYTMNAFLNASFGKKGYFGEGLEINGSSDGHTESYAYANYSIGNDNQFAVEVLYNYRDRQGFMFPDAGYNEPLLAYKNNNTDLASSTYGDGEFLMTRYEHTWASEYATANYTENKNDGNQGVFRPTNDSFTATTGDDIMIANKWYYHSSTVNHTQWYSNDTLVGLEGNNTTVENNLYGTGNSGCGQGLVIGSRFNGSCGIRQGSLILFDGFVDELRYRDEPSTAEWGEVVTAQPFTASYVKVQGTGTGTPPSLITGSFTELGDGVGSLLRQTVSPIIAFVVGLAIAGGIALFFKQTIRVKK